MDAEGLMFELSRAGVFRFGDFRLKNGESSPFFFDLGSNSSGGFLGLVSYAFADVIERRFPDVGIIYGPAYKGISLAVSTVMAVHDVRLRRVTGGYRPVRYLYARKESKAHGEGGDFVGGRPQPGDKLLLVDDVFTDGGTKAVEVQRISSEWPGVKIVGILVVLDRDQKASASFESKYGISVVSMLCMEDVRRHFPSI